MSAAVSRQRANARQFLRVIAALYEASATVNLHMGDMDRYRTAIIAQGRTLGENLPGGDPEILLMAVRLGHFWARQREFREARRQFRQAAEGYVQRGDARLSALCHLRVVALDIALRDFAEAANRLGRIDNSAVSAEQPARTGSAVLRARLAAARGEDVDLNALLAAPRSEPGSPPILIRPGTMSSAATAASEQQWTGDGTRRATGGGGQTLWADIGFMIGADGRVSDVEVLGGSRASGWISPYLGEIAGRVYTPSEMPSGQLGHYRVERYTLRAEREVPTGSLIRQPWGPRFVEILDMTRRDAATTRAD